MSMGTINNRTYGGIILGIEIRGTIAKQKIFRVRRGNGFYTSKLGTRYQDQYAYVVPSSINNVQSQPYRQQLIAAVHKWKFDLTDAEKKAYNTRASKGLRMGGYHLFMREAMKGLVDMYVDRGDPAAYDFAVGDLTTDGAWHDLDLSSIVPAGAKIVSIMGMLEGANVNWNITFRQKGNSNEINHDMMSTIRAGVLRHRNNIVSVDANRVIQYNADNVAWDTLDLVVRGWWT